MGKNSLACFITGIILFVSAPVYAAWETGVKVGYDSNVNRTISDAVGDTYVGAYLQYAREVSGETRLDWTFGASLEGNAFLENSDLSHAGVTLAPGIIFFPYLTWSINIYPFVQGKVFSDSDQSAVAFGAKINLKQPLGKYVYLGEYYIYTDNRADMDIYSYTENALGVVLGINWTRAFFTEIGYEFSRGDSFRTLEEESTTTITTTGRGRGNRYGYSSTFSSDLYKEDVDRHSIGFTIGMEIFPSLSSNLSYTYSTMTGDLGTSHNHAGLVGISYRF
ncbi:MAG: hypothetical protein WBN66_12230 [Smithella sp.]